MPATKMMTLEDLPSRRRPHVSYKRDLFARIEQISPESILDVGCGSGDLLQAAAEAGIARCTGIEIDAGDVEELRARGIEVHLGRGEDLDFPDQSFDIVVFDYVAHHIEYLDRALLEAIRVARRAILVLDPWYDLSFQSQRVARDFDFWLKRIDRRLGMIHDPSISGARLAGPFRGLRDWQLEFRHRLILQPIPIESIAEQAVRQLGSAGSPRHLEDEMEVLLDQAREHGISEDGAILFEALRSVRRSD